MKRRWRSYEVWYHADVRQTDTPKRGVEILVTDDEGNQRLVVMGEDVARWLKAALADEVNKWDKEDAEN